MDRTMLAGRHALVCGASKGIGRATAIALARSGAAVTVLARSQPLLDALVETMRAEGATARSLCADLDDLAALQGTVGDLLEAHGPVHVLVHNTGGPPGGLLLDAPTDALLHAFRRHVLSAHQLVQTLLPGMRSSGYGRIVSVLSTSVREPIPNLGVSNTIRAAMASWAKSLSRELPPGITINNVLPGFTETGRLGELGQALAARTGTSMEAVRQGWIDQVPEGRLASPDEIAAAIAFLASPGASYIRGVSLPVDGGRLRGV